MKHVHVQQVESGISDFIWFEMTVSLTGKPPTLRSPNDGPALESLSSGAG